MIAPTTSAACEDGEARYFFCTFGAGKKAVEICHDTREARYVYGPVGDAPELQLIRSLGDVHLTPWPGIGRTVWEEVVFLNDGHSYTVYANIERIYPENETDEITAIVSGGILVERGRVEIARLRCDPDSVDFPWSTELFDAKLAAGQCYDQSERTWQTCRRDNEGDRP